VKSSSRPRSWLPPKSAFAGFRFPVEVIVVAVRWYLRYNLSYRDVEELLGERGVEVDHVTVYRWVQAPPGTPPYPPAETSHHASAVSDVFRSCLRYPWIQVRGR
jgi:hypothetical protein